MFRPSHVQNRMSGIETARATPVLATGKTKILIRGNYEMRFNIHKLRARAGILLGIVNDGNGLKRWIKGKGKMKEAVRSRG